MEEIINEDVNKDVNEEQLKENEEQSKENEEQPKENEEQSKKKAKPSVWWTILRIVIALVIIAAGVFLILYIIARAAKYETILAMLQSMYIELELMWQRIRY